MRLPPSYVFPHLDGPIRANCFKDPELNPFFRESPFRALKNANRRFEAIRANRSKVMKIVFLSANRVVRIDSRKSPRWALRITRPSQVLHPPHIITWPKTWHLYNLWAKMPTERWMDSFAISALEVRGSLAS